MELGRPVTAQIPCAERVCRHTPDDDMGGCGGAQAEAHGMTPEWSPADGGDGRDADLLDSVQTLSAPVPSYHLQAHTSSMTFCKPPYI